MGARASFETCSDNNCIRRTGVNLMITQLLSLSTLGLIVAPQELDPCFTALGGRTAVPIVAEDMPASSASTELAKHMAVATNRYAILSDDGKCAITADEQFSIYDLPSGRHFGRNLIQFFLLKGSGPRLRVADWSQVAHFEPISEADRLFPRADPRLARANKSGTIGYPLALRDKGHLLSAAVEEGVTGGKRRGFCMFAVVKFAERGSDPNDKWMLEYDARRFSMKPIGGRFTGGLSAEVAVQRYDKSSRTARILVFGLEASRAEPSLRYTTPLDLRKVNPFAQRGQTERAVLEHSRFLWAPKEPAAVTYLLPGAGSLTGVPSPAERIDSVFSRPNQIVWQVFSDKVFAYDSSERNWRFIAANESALSDPSTRGIKIRGIDGGTAKAHWGYWIRGESANARFWLVERIRDRSLWLLGF